jgi:hypothetical protein
VGKHSVKRPRHSLQVQRLHEQRPESALPAAFAAEESPELLFDLPSAPSRLLLE